MDGSLFPARFLIVRAVGDQSFGTPSKTSTVTMELDIFLASDVLGSSGEEGEVDALDELRQEFPEDISSTAGGVRITGLGDQVELASEPAHSVNVGVNSISVDASKHDISYMVEIAGPGGEVLGRKWVYGVAEMCSTWARDVDIKYSWSSISSSQVLTPNYARATSQINKPEKTFETGSASSSEVGLATYLPRCGDHEGRWLFSPYETCEQSKFYINDGGIILTGSVPTGEVWDERYRGPMQQRPFSKKHNPAGVFSKCVFEWTFGTTTQLDPSWAGLARLRGPITELINTFQYSQYLVKGWVFPQFGNKGRDHIRTYRTMHYREYLYNGGASGPKVGAGWMPAIPFVGSTGVFDDSKPRTLFDYAAESSSLPAINYHSYEGQQEAILAAVEGQPPAATNFEVIPFNRYSYSDAFTVKRPGNVGDGVQWPPDGWYFNPKDVSTLWGFPEPVTDIARNFDDTFLRGIVFRKPKPEGEDLLQDRFGRPIDVGPLEGLIEIKFRPSNISTEGVVDEYATVFIQEEFPLYFDMSDGSIQDTDFEGNPAIYSGLTPEEFTEILIELGVEPEIVPVYPPINTAEEDELPEDLEDLAEISFYGNVAADMSKCYVYATNGPTGNNLDDDEIIWKGFFRSVEVQDIRVNLLPTITVPAEDLPEIEEASATYENYPSPDPITRGIFSGIELDALGSTPILGSADTRNLVWEPYSESDLQLPDPSEGSGSIGPISNTLTFSTPARIVSIAFSYEVFPRQQGFIYPESLAGPFTDPQVILKLVGDEDLLLLEKPLFKLPGDGEVLIREFLFDEENFESFAASEVVLQVGSRDDATGIRISAFEIRVEQVAPEQETFSTINPKIILSRGYGTDEDQGLYLPSQRKFISAITTTADQPDRLEVSNIAEFWQPGMASLDPEVAIGTRGKIRRHWASGFLTYDTLKWLGEDTSEAVFVDADVSISEKRQENQIKNVLDIIEELVSYKEDILEYFLLPQDQ
ncbi:MAG: hypothetical protein DRQ35_06160, partial [Gammaproteobacteria bacterium]